MREKQYANKKKAENFPELMKDINVQILVQQIPRSINKKEIHT